MKLSGMTSPVKSLVKCQQNSLGERADGLAEPMGSQADIFDSLLQTVDIQWEGIAALMDEGCFIILQDEISYSLKSPDLEDYSLPTEDMEDFYFHVLVECLSLIQERESADQVTFQKAEEAYKEILTEQDL